MNLEMQSKLGRLSFAKLGKVNLFRSYDNQCKIFGDINLNTIGSINKKCEKIIDFRVENAN